MSKKFKIGDKVKTLISWFDHPYGAEGIIHDMRGHAYIVDINGQFIRYLDNELELIEEAGTYLPTGSQGAFISAAHFTAKVVENHIKTENFQFETMNKCECGAHSVGIDKHAYYCQLYKKDNS